MITHNKFLVAKLLIGEMGYIAFAIQYAIYATENRERSTHGRFLGGPSSRKILQLYDNHPDEIVEVCMT